MRPTPRTIFLGVLALIVVGAGVWIRSSRSGGPLDPIVTAAEGHGRTAIVGDDALRIALGSSLDLAPSAALDPALDGTDEAALLAAMQEAGIGSIVVGHRPAPDDATPTLRSHLESYDALESLACIHLTPTAALYMPRSELVLSPMLSGALAHVARAIVGGSSVPRVQSFPEPLRRIHNVEVMVLLSEGDRPRLWRSARGSSVARALITAATVARQRWMERESAMGGPLGRILPTLDVSVQVLEEDGTLDSRAHAFVETAFRPGHGVAFEHRGNWHYLLPDATRERGEGSAVRAYAALFSDQDMAPESLDRPDLRLYRSVARRVASSPAPSRAPASVTPEPSRLHAPEASVEGLDSL